MKAFLMLSLILLSLLFSPSSTTAARDLYARHFKVSDARAPSTSVTPHRGRGSFGYSAARDHGSPKPEKCDPYRRNCTGNPTAEKCDPYRRNCTGKPEKCDPYRRNCHRN
ncbi:hypothetical protein FEM48_Zijuj04G0066800 [Ziziphus jujuba var. spinosa]|uniref:Uncharacterized protein n=1 Tax=Ziziphus jujuba var. spinosa TaxID=714518 RepID=A0A978VID5_ZIZJJ|nr:hypothetical protein FEM48_Zijuj04G0066800 [Ziziphus jujuba var. spinosa]